MYIVKLKYYHLAFGRKADLHTLFLTNVQPFIIILLLFPYYLFFRVLISPCITDERTLQGHEEPVIIFSQSWSTELLDIFFCLQGDYSKHKIKLFDQKQI